MQQLWSSASYQPHLLSLAFAFAPAAILVVLAYAAAMRGAPTLRGFLLGHGIALMPYATVMMLSPSIASPVLAERLFEIAIAFIPMAGATGTGLQLALIGASRRSHGLVWLCVATAAVWIYAGSTGHGATDGVRRLSGFWYPNAGRWAWLTLLHTIALTLPGFLALGRAARTSERRQLRAALCANLVSYVAFADALLAYGVTMVPLAWLASGIGSLLLVRALVVDDVLRVRRIDPAAPLLVVYFAAGALLGWMALVVLGRPLPWPWTALTLVLCFLAIRVAVATVGLVIRGARVGVGWGYDRLLAQLVDRARAMTAPPALAALALDVLELGLAVRPQVLLASPRDGSWTTHTGERLDDARAPDPQLASWLADHRDAVFAADLDAVAPELRGRLAQLFASHGARVLVPVASADALLGLVLVPANRRVRGPGLEFLARAAERLAEALLHARLALRAGERIALAREVELAATVQAELLPGAGRHVHGEVTVVGSWQPATRCTGDFWTVRPLDPPGQREPRGDDRGGRAGCDPVLIAIGDVTGHGVAAAMVTAGAIGACDVCVRRSGAALDLGELVAALDAAVRRVGGGRLAMTCFVAILDPAAREIRFVSSGHAAPYLCRATGVPTDEPGIHLHALVGRGNPLGTGRAAPARVQRRPLEAGDLVVWYTDGVVEAQDVTGAAYGDRRLQHLLKTLDRRRLTPVTVHQLVQRSVAAHRAGRPRGDDETLVVAQFGAAPP